MAKESNGFHNLGEFHFNTYVAKKEEMEFMKRQRVQLREKFLIMHSIQIRQRKLNFPES